MITIFLNVNLLYILHFQRNIYFYIYAVVVVTTSLKKKRKKRSPLVPVSDNGCM